MLNYAVHRLALERSCRALCRKGILQASRSENGRTGLSAARSSHDRSGDRRVRVKDPSSQRWLIRQTKDPYVKQAKVENWRCRSAFKLIEIDDRFHLLAAGMTVVDCGAAPGSWSQVAVSRVNSLGQEAGKPRGMVVSVDRDYFDPVEGALTFRNADLTSRSVQDHVTHVIGSQRVVDVILSDMAPNATGHASLDHERIVELLQCALRFGSPLLKAEGTFLCKLWEGYLLQKTLTQLQAQFCSVRRVKPKSSRDDSAEIFVLACGYRVPDTATGVTC